MPCDRCLKATKETLNFITAAGLDFAKTYATGISLFYSKGIDADYHGTPEDINKDGKVTQIKQLLPMNLITEVHKIGLQVHTYTFRNETTACSDYNNDPSRVPSFYKLGLMQCFLILQIQL
jgi:glycerophosphoryl diester phosphodiesterase